MTETLNLLGVCNLRDTTLDNATGKYYKYEQSCVMEHDNLGLLEQQSSLFSTGVKVENDLVRAHEEFVSLSMSNGDFIIETHAASIHSNLLDKNMQNENKGMSQNPMIKIEVTPDLPCNFEANRKLKLTSNEIVPREEHRDSRSQESIENKPYCCAHCGKGYKTKISIIRHIKLKNCLSKLLSRDTVKKTVNSQKRGPRIVRLADNRYQCRHCDKTYTQKNNLFRHMREDHVKLSEPTRCDVCEKMFFNLTKLNQHLRCHSRKPYECSVCCKRFAQIAHLQSHMLTHTGEKPYQCHICEKRFSKSFNLKIHINRHNGERKYKCRVCQTEFFTHGDLDKHMRIHTAERPYCCDTCGKRFKQNSHLKKHLLSHTGMKPYKCTMCKKDYVNSSHLKRHMRTHTGEKLPECQCPICGNNFSEPSTLKRHMIKVHRKLPNA